MFFDPLYLILVMLPGLLIAGGASFLVRRAYTKYSRVPARSMLTGSQAARRILEQSGIYDVEVVQTHGYLTDHYNPTNKTLALSPDVYSGYSLASVGIAAHEAGHAIQHARHYAPLAIRSAVVPMASIGSNIGYLVMFCGLFIHPYVVALGIALFGAVLLFQLVTLPVEFDASNRAKQLVVDYGIVAPDERTGIDRVLNAAALTYVAAVVSTLLTILYFLIRSGLLGGSDD